jgi:hypothetical protein
MHTGKELEAHSVQKWRLSCNSRECSVRLGKGRKIESHKTNRRKTRPYCIILKRS